MMVAKYVVTQYGWGLNRDVMAQFVGEGAVDWDWVVIWIEGS